MRNEEIFNGLTYDEKLDRIPGEFQHLRIVMKSMGASEIPDSNIGFGDEKKNETVRTLQGQTTYRIAYYLLKGQMPRDLKVA